jgi:hypothetical protein
MKSATEYVAMTMESTLISPDATKNAIMSRLKPLLLRRTGMIVHKCRTKGVGY